MIMRLALRIAAALTFAACVHAPPRVSATERDAGTLLVTVVRHAEKAPLPADDPVLSVAGTTRARALDSVMRKFPVTDVVVSQLHRTRLTAADVIARTGAVVHVVAIGSAGIAAHIQSVADTVRAIAGSRGRGAVLVVGHSNTVTQIVDALGGGSVLPLCDSQYSQLFVLRGRLGGATALTRSTYGAADPVDATCATSAPGMFPRP